MHGFRRFGLLALVGALVVSPPPAASAQGYPYCGSGHVPQFVHGFAALKARIGAVMGEPAECEHPNSANGDTHQQTTAGLSFWRKATNTPTFTDGYRHWGLTANGLVYWEGSSIDPPGGTVGSSPPPPPPPPPMPTPTRQPGCDPSYPTVCIPPPPPDLDCLEVRPLRGFRVLPPDPHRFDGDKDGFGCD